MSTVPIVNPAQSDEQGRSLPGAQPRIGGGPAPLGKVDSPLQLDNASGIIRSSGLGAPQSGPSKHLNPMQFTGQGAEPEAGAAEGAGEAAGIGELAEIAPLALLA